MDFKFFVIFALGIIANAFANIALKLGMRGESSLAGQSLLAMAWEMVFNPWVWIGILSFGVSFILYSVVLTRMNLSIAYPTMTGVGFVIISIVSVLLFHESISLVQAGGLALIIAGIWIVSVM